MTPQPIDLQHQVPGIVGSYVLETDDGLALFDCGPTTTIAHLKAGLAERGLDITEVKHLLLSHIHLDHAGAAGVLVRENPWLQVHVSEVGAPHLIDPAKLESSARRLYGDAFDALWGELAPIPTENVHVVGDRVVGLECFRTGRSTPGTRPACGSAPGASSLHPALRPSSTSTPGSGRLRRSRRVRLAGSR